MPLQVHVALVVPPQGYFSIRVCSCTRLRVLIVLMRRFFVGFCRFMTAKNILALKILYVVWMRVTYDEGKMTVVCLTLWVNLAY